MRPDVEAGRGVPATEGGGAGDGLKRADARVPGPSTVERLAPVVAFGALLATPLVVGNPYVLHLLIMWGIYGILTLSLTVVTGFSGQFAFGQAAFYGIGAYASAILVGGHGVSFVGGLAAAAVLSALVGVLLAVPFQRLYGIYLGMATFAFGEIARLAFENWEGLTMGPLGIKDIPVPVIAGFEFGDQRSYFYLVMASMAIVLALVFRLHNSAPGQALLAIREDEVAASTLGIPTRRYKIAAFGIGAAIAGISGSLFAHYITYISPNNFTVMISILVLTMMIVGGASNILGALVGAAVLVTLPEALRVVPPVRMVLYGALLVVMATLRPQGILGSYRWGQRPPRAPAGAVGGAGRA